MVWWVLDFLEIKTLLSLIIWRPIRFYLYFMLFTVAFLICRFLFYVLTPFPYLNLVLLELLLSFHFGVKCFRNIWVFLFFWVTPCMCGFMAYAYSNCWKGWDSWMASPTWWTWIWPSSGSWWWTGRPGVLQFMGSQRVRDDGATELNWWHMHCCPKKVKFNKSLLSLNVLFFLLFITIKQVFTWNSP